MTPTDRPEKEWTLMFYFASDNPQAPEVVSQLKALQSAGYHPEANVIAYFDPRSDGTPTHIFDVNVIRKLNNPEPDIGFTANDPFVRDLMLDKLWGDELSRDEKTPIRDLIQQLHIKPGYPFDLPKPPPFKETRPKESLHAFLTFCADNYKAKHYMLFILGHGLVVGDDVFLLDEHADERSLTLRDLGDVLEKFKTRIGTAEFELVSFHSCSMSGLEVAYELQCTANYMLASQGPTYVGSWPYKQILIRLFNDLGDKPPYETKIDVEKMLERIFYYVLNNSTDFVLAGYCFDLCLCDLRKIKYVQAPLTALSKALITGMADAMVINSILLAHWKSQSYWQENYTDLYDFCFCLKQYCEQFSAATKYPEPYATIMVECDNVMEVLKTPAPNNPVLFAEFAGPNAQYSHGLSLFFPWTRPIADKKIMNDYEHYNFAETGWLEFLKKYWGPQDSKASVDGSTMRLARRNEPDSNTPVAAPKPVSAVKAAELKEDMASYMFNAEGPLSTSGTLSSDPPKPVPGSSQGDDCTCGSIKNFVRDTRKRRDRNKKTEPPIPFSQTFFSQP